MRGMKIVDGIVDNIAVFDEIPEGWILWPSGVGMGWVDSGGGVFEDPNPARSMSLKQQSGIDKLSGVLFEGVMCSATKEDMWGLKAVEDDVSAGLDVPFKFDNGSVLVLTKTNLGAFRAVWVPFRASFFTVPV